MIIYADFRKRRENPLLGMVVAVLLSIPVWLVIWAWTCWLFA